MFDYLWWGATIIYKNKWTTIRGIHERTSSNENNNWLTIATNTRDTEFTCTQVMLTYGKYSQPIHKLAQAAHSMNRSNWRWHRNWTDILPPYPLIFSLRKECLLLFPATWRLKVGLQELNRHAKLAANNGFSWTSSGTRPPHYESVVDDIKGNWRPKSAIFPTFFLQSLT